MATATLHVGMQLVRFQSLVRDKGRWNLLGDLHHQHPALLSIACARRGSLELFGKIVALFNGDYFQSLWHDRVLWNTLA